MNSVYLLSIVGAALGSGLMSGLFFTFSNFVMKALASLPAHQGAVAMQEINLKILNPLFLGVFLGTAVFSLIAAVFAVLQWEHSGAGWVLAGALLYLVGGIVVTGICNVPLNNQLAAVDSESTEMIGVWGDYLVRWIPWNHIRSAATLAATAAFLMALYRLGGGS